MSDSSKIYALLEWCTANSIFLDAGIRIGSGGSDAERGLGVFAKNHFILPQTTLVKIRKDSVLSIRTSSIASSLPNHAYGLEAQLYLSLALCAEVLKGRRSRWHGYLQSLPNGIVDIPLLWDIHGSGDDSEALSWLEGTEAGKILATKTENDRTKLAEVTRFYYAVAEPLLLENAGLWPDANTRTSGLSEFYRAFSLVSSRAFLVDASHGLSMVPIADIFNHVIENHVHLESDYDVCPECGSLHECPHDREEGIPSEATPSNAAQISDADHDEFFEMVLNTAIPPNAEIFNTYGENLSNAQLLNQYGFILDVNHNDRLKWDLDEIVQILLLRSGAEIVLETLNEEVHEALTGLSGDVFSHSQLVYCETSAENFFCLNDEGTMSHQLWVLLLILGIRCYAPPHLDIVTVAPAVLALQKFLENVDNIDDGDDHMSEDGEVPEHDPYVLKILLWICNSIVQICNTRKHSSGRTKSDTLESLSDVMESIPSERRRTILALTLLMGERSMLDCCESTWTALLSSATCLLDGKRPAILTP